MKARLLCGLTLGTVLALATAPCAVWAQAKAPVEVGFSLANASVLTSEGDSMWLVSTPANAFFSFMEPGLHACLGLGQRLGFEPQVGLMHVGGDEYSVTVLSLRGQLNASFQPWRSRTAYLFGHAGALVTSDDSQGHLGFGVGYRVPIRDHAVVRWEAFYNRFLDTDTSQFGGRIKLGILF